MSNQAKQPLKKASKSPLVSSDQGLKEESPIQVRIQAWKEKKTKSETGVRFISSQDEKRSKTVHLSPDLKKNANLEGYKESDVAASLYSAVSGSGCEDYSRLFIAEAMGALMNGSDNHKASMADAFHGAMLGMKPEDEIEAQLCARLLLLNSKSMQLMNSAMSTDNEKIMDLYINRYTKLVRLYNETLEALNRYRRKGEQRVKVVHQYVQVNEGGQAVVTGEFSRGGGKTKRRRSSPCQ